MAVRNCVDCGTEMSGVYRNKRYCDECKRKRRGSYAVRYPKQRMLTCARSRAKTNELPFEITETDINIPDTCPVLGIKLESGFGKGSHTDFSPSLDKIVPSLGYVPGNVVVMSSRANRMKSNGSAEEHRRLADWLESNPQVAVEKYEPEYHVTPIPKKPKTMGIKSEETRRKMSESQAKAWARRRGVVMKHIPGEFDTPLCTPLNERETVSDFDKAYSW